MDPVEVREQHVATGTGPVTPTGTGYATGTGIVTHATTVQPVGYRLQQLVWLIVGIIDVFLALDFIFRLAHAGATGFVEFVYAVANFFASPFDGIFGMTVTNHTYVARWGDIVGIVIYTLVALAVNAIIRIVSTPRQGTVA